jgi:hypothetical protein
MNSETESTTEPSAGVKKPFAPEIKNPVRLWLLVVVLGWVFDFLFWEHPVGVSFATFLVLSLGCGLYFLLAEGYKPSLNSLWLLIPTIFFVVFTFLRREPLTVFLAYAFALFSVGTFTATYLGGRWLQYGMSDYFSRFFRILGSMLTRQWGFFQHVQKERKERGNAWEFPVGAIARGCLFSLPVLIVFTVLLASADAVFNQKIADFFDLFDTGKIFEYVFRLLIVLYCAYAISGIFLYAAASSQDEKLLGEDRPTPRQFLGFTEASVVLGSVAILFLLFVIVQFRYFFGGQSNIGIAQYTYSEYARRGFNELVTVGFFSLLLVMGLGTITRRETEIQRKAYSWLGVVILLLVLVILTSAYQRLNMAIDWHGFSRLRLYPQVCLIWVGILFVVVVLLEIFHWERYFALSFVLASMGFAASLILFNVDSAIVNRNVFRASQGKNLNVGHLASLSTDAIPALVAAYQSGDVSDATREGLGSVLLCYVKSNKLEFEQDVDWRSFNYSDWLAVQRLKEIQPQLVGYRVTGYGSSLRVRTPANVQYECQGIY